MQPSALVRFATAFGFSGFAALRQVFRSHLVARAPSYRERIATLRRTSQAGTAGDVVRMQIDEAINSIRDRIQRAAMKSRA